MFGRRGRATPTPADRRRDKCPSRRCFAVQIDERVQMRERIRRSRDRLDRRRGHRPLEPLVIAPCLVLVIRSCKLAHFGCKRRLITDGADGIRPRSALTSEPAWVKRKMLSMKRSVSAPVSSRKYSAIVSALDSATRRRAPGGSFIWPKTITVWSMTCLPVVPIWASCISSQRSVPFAGSFTDAGEDCCIRRAAARCGRSVPE